MSESVTGYIDHIIFRNEDNGYTVLVLKGTEGDDEELTCVGTFPVISQGATIEASEILSIIIFMENSFRSPLYRKNA